jgi:5-(carboxyamino)imidazole ribonucleotide mutase
MQMSARVAVIMGSDSDLSIMIESCDVMDQLGIEYETTIISAHRTPNRAVEYARGAAGRGLGVIIAGAGGAAHLPGVIAALTDLPVIGVPVRGSSMEGFDSLLSIVQMPQGIPVATVGINNARNAGLLAARILGVADDEVRSRVAEYRTRAETEVIERAKELERKGPRHYLKDQGGA